MEPCPLLYERSQWTKSFRTFQTANMTAKDLESVFLTPGLKLTTATIFRRQVVKVTDEAIALHFLICGTLLGQSPTVRLAN